VLSAREQLQKLYMSSPAADLPYEKQRGFDDLRRRYEDLKASWGGYSGYDDWFSHDLNNAKLNTIANYYDLVPGFQHLLELNGGDMQKFYDAVQEVAKLPPDRRHEELRRGLGVVQPSG